MRRMLTTLACATAAAVAVAAVAPDAARAEYQPYAGQVGYFVTYQQAYGEQGYSVVHPGYSTQSYNWQTAQSRPAAARPLSPQPVYAPALEYSTAPPLPPPYGLVGGWAPGYPYPPAYPRPSSAH